MDATPHFAFPFPEGSDSPNGPAQIGALAQAVEDAIPIRSSGVSAVAAAQSTGSTSFVELGTPDRAEDIVLPTDGLIFVAFQALWKRSAGSGFCGADIFLGTDQVKLPYDAGAPIVGGASTNLDDYNWLGTTALGLLAGAGTAGDASGPATTGQIVRPGWSGAGGVSPGGGCALIQAAAGTYDVSVRFKADSGTTVTAQQRKLWVASMAFG